MDLFDWKIVPKSTWIDVYNPNFTGDGKPVQCCSPVDDSPWIDGGTREAFPKTVWAAPHAVERLLRLAEERLDTIRRDRVVVFSGTEMPLSRAFGSNDSARRATVARLRKYFSRILYQAKDIELEHVHLAPMGLSWGYTMGVLKHWVDRVQVRPLWAYFADHQQSLNNKIYMKTRGVLAAGTFAAGWLESNTTLDYIGLLAAHGRLFPPSNSSLLAVASSYESRLRLRGWLGMTVNGTEVTSAAARAVGVEYRRLNLMEWWQELPQYRFLLSPVGSGIQVAKNIEALLVLTVPIIQQMSFTPLNELVRLGFPIVLVRGWVEVTVANTTRWWNVLSSRLESFRSNCLSVQGYWQMYTGQVAFCT